MSAFLGPIHHWLYNKIKIQNELVEVLFTEMEKTDAACTIRKQVEEKVGSWEVRPLEECIDESNIHGWLQDRVSFVERKLSYGVTLFLEGKKDGIDVLNQAAYAFGKTLGEQNAVAKIESAPKMFQVLQDLLLDGMPCDHVNQVTKSEEECVQWEKTICIHSKYWQEISGDVANYYVIRNAFVSGMLSTSKFVLNTVCENEFELVKEN